MFLQPFDCKTALAVRGKRRNYEKENNLGGIDCRHVRVFARRLFVCGFGQVYICAVHRQQFLQRRLGYAYGRACFGIRADFATALLSQKLRRLQKVGLLDLGNQWRRQSVQPELSGRFRRNCRLSAFGVRKQRTKRRYRRYSSFASLLDEGRRRRPLDKLLFAHFGQKQLLSRLLIARRYQRV